MSVLFLTQDVVSNVFTSRPVCPRAIGKASSASLLQIRVCRGTISRCYPGAQRESSLQESLPPRCSGENHLKYIPNRHFLSIANAIGVVVRLTCATTLPMTSSDCHRSRSRLQECQHSRTHRSLAVHAGVKLSYTWVASSQIPSMSASASWPATSRRRADCLAVAVAFKNVTAAIRPVRYTRHRRDSPTQGSTLSQFHRHLHRLLACILRVRRTVPSQSQSPAGYRRLHRSHLVQLKATAVIIRGRSSKLHALESVHREFHRCYQTPSPSTSRDHFRRYRIHTLSHTRTNRC